MTEEGGNQERRGQGGRGDKMERRQRRKERLRSLTPEQAEQHASDRLGRIDEKLAQARDKGMDADQYAKLEERATNRKDRIGQRLEKLRARFSQRGSGGESSE